MAQQITNLKAKAKMKFSVQIPNGDLVHFYFYFLPSQRGWYFDIEYGTFKSTGLHLVNSYNVLRAYFNVLRFGLACRVIDGSEPYFVNDFATGRVLLYILTEEEVNTIEEAVYA